MKNSVQRFGKFLSAMIIGPLSNMPMTAIEYFGKLGEKDPFFKELDACCKRNKELWYSARIQLIEEWRRTANATRNFGQKRQRLYCLNILEEKKHDLYRNI